MNAALVNESMTFFLHVMYSLWLKIKGENYTD